MTYYLWHSDSVEQGLKAIIDREGPQPDYFGYPLITHFSAALTETGQVVTYTERTESEQAPGFAKDYTLVGAFEQAVPLFTHEGITDAGRALTVQKGVPPLINEIAKLAVPRPGL